MSFDALYHPYPSYRMPSYARSGMVATSQPLAAQAGLDILRRGGNAIDAAVATAAALTVVEPCSNGIGGDAFALVWTGGQLYGLSSNGPAPSSVSVQALQERGHESMPRLGAIPVTVPGAPAAWAELSSRFGKLELDELLEPAANYAERGYPVSPTAALNWERAYNHYTSQLRSTEIEAWVTTFAPSGRAPRAGELWSSPDHARTLRSIGRSGGKSFYQGELAERIATCMRELGGYLSAADMAMFEPEWVEPIHTRYRDYEVWEIPPSGQGLVALQALTILDGFEFRRDELLNAETAHRQIEAMKLAFSDGLRYITDPRRMNVSVEELLSAAYTEQRRALIGEKARLPEPGQPGGSGTVYLATADGEGNMVSFIQSNYMGFGSGIVVPGTGIALQNRGADFSLDPQHANVLEPGKKTYHTIIPGFLTRGGGQPVGPFGVMGGYMQPQGHVQAVMNLVDFALHPQAALDAPRWQWHRDLSVSVEPHFPLATAQALERMGHRITRENSSGSFGRGQIILRDPATGVLCGGTDFRTDGIVAGW
ncbi:gamma-glutamyltransferase family protein [Paenibacillus herberti]|uniref:Gamma-glutamyltransferase n=1 Tax=Paenibacillus herberti TaxID=1619309 RepID=A0A229NV80_9BACL|nr:gamma-glutamyltransferase family protein [Paenibacillus herberti]OXM13813.1 gamma-glutamyltransferase [Paenibacillus herberti]